MREFSTNDCQLCHCSVRVSNELGAAHPRTAKFSVVVVVVSSFLLGVVLSAILLIFRQQYPSLFSNSDEVKSLVYELTPLLAFCIVLNTIQPALSGESFIFSPLIGRLSQPSTMLKAKKQDWQFTNGYAAGVAIGAGWQALVAYVNIACYYLFGIPLGLLLGYKINMGVKVSSYTGLRY